MTSTARTGTRADTHTEQAHGEEDGSLTRPGRRRLWGWAALVAAVVVLGTALAFISQDGWQDKQPLDPEHPGPEGGRALAQLLADQGVDVVVAHSREEALDAVGPGDTLAIAGTWFLSDDHLDETIRSAGRTVLLDPDSRDVRLSFGGGDGYGGHGAETLGPACALPEARRAGPIQPGAMWAEGSADDACYPAAGDSGDGSTSYGLLAGDVDGTEVVLVDGAQLFANDRLADGGNASLGLGLLGSQQRLVWYMPSEGDVSTADRPDTLGSLTPPWITPAILLLAVTTVAAGIWRGRRFGPLVAETLPVTVRGSETLEGRARLYQRANDPLHAAILIRDGAVARMGARLGLHRRASVAEVASAAAARIGARRGEVAALLENLPQSDGGLAGFGERLRDLERGVDAAVRTERKTQ